MDHIDFLFFPSMLLHHLIRYVVGSPDSAGITAIKHFRISDTNQTPTPAPDHLCKAPPPPPRTLLDSDEGPAHVGDGVRDDERARPLAVASRGGGEPTENAPFYILVVRVSKQNVLQNKRSYMF